MRWVATSVRLTTAPIGQMCQPNCNDQIAARAFGATVHYSPLEIQSHAAEFDAVFVTMSKVREQWEPRWMDAVHRMVDAGKKVVLFQEAETSWPMTRSWEEIQSFVQLLGKVDLFLTHNFRDVSLWGSLCSNAVRWRTCLDLSHASKRMITPELKTQQILLCGSSYDARANGITALVACGSFGRPLWHQNRSTGYADRNKGLPELLGVTVEREIEHCGWGEWLEQVSSAYIAVHPMPAAAAGRDQIAFAALGIPCVGNTELDIQRELFPPELGVTDIYDVGQIRAKIGALLDDPKFYNYCRARALTRIEMYGLQGAVNQAAAIKEMLGW